MRNTNPVRRDDPDQQGKPCSRRDALQILPGIPAAR